MTTLEWREMDGAYVCDGYRIERSAGHDWSVIPDALHTRSISPRRGRPDLVYGSLQSARAAVLHLEVTRVRRIKLIRNVTAAVVMYLLAGVFYAVMASGTEATRLEWFAVAGVSLVIALSESLDAFVLLVADGWDHRYEVPRLSGLDRLVSTVVISTLWPRVPSRVASEPTPSVQPLT